MAIDEVLKAELKAAREADFKKFEEMFKGYVSLEAMKEMEVRLSESVGKLIPASMRSVLAEAAAPEVARRQAMLHEAKWAISEKYRSDEKLWISGHKALDLAVGANGGYLVGSALASEILMAVRDAQWIEPLSFVQNNMPVKGNMPTEGTGPTFYWGTGVNSITASAVTFGNLGWNLTDVTGLQQIGNNLVQYADYDVLAFLNKVFAAAYAEELAKKYVLGTGSGEPLGILATPGCYSTAQAGANFSEDDVKACDDALPSKFKGGNDSIWIASKNVIGYIGNLKDGQGNYLFLNPREGRGKGLTGTGMPETGMAGYLKGYPVYESPDMPDTKLVRVKMGWHWVYKGKDLEIAASSDSQFGKNMLEMRVVGMVDSKIVVPTAVSILTGISV